ncbi:MAG: hypothetical protein E7415_05950 [Ruminococcaceae bacterium]|nr:hypothetical protein [Oscillospiraceae bacterium]
MFLDIITDFFKLCPALSGKKLNQNFLAPSVSSCSLLAVSDNPVYKTYTDGGVIYQSFFRLVLREPFDPRFNFSSFYSSFLSWVESVNSPSSLPYLGEKYSPVSLSVVKSGEITASSSSFSEYEILCRFLYS